MKRNNAGVPWPDPEREPGGEQKKGLPPLGSPGGSSSKRLPPLKRRMEPGSMKKAITKPVAPKPTRFDNRRIAK